MKVIAIVFLVAILHQGLAQIGIKTHRPASGNLVVNRTSSGNLEFGVYPQIPPSGFQPGQPPMDPLTAFINQTRSQIPTGVCFTEVPTASLVKDKSQGIPVGNSSDPTMSVIQICCQGYERNVHNFKQCDPICLDGCINGICTAPGECRCFPDSVKNIAGFCVPTCPIGCGNGDCLPNGSCQCKPGYVLEPTLKKFCIPSCPKGCVNGNCTAPDVCQCNAGFENNELGNCIPKCDKCENGKCTAPGICQCNNGYIKKEGRCEPVCSKGCNNGICVAPEQCECRPGWTLDPSGFNCIAHCQRACLNGFCSGSNVCTCNPGYVLDVNNPFICIAHCPEGCPNGFCTAPNMCLCKPGYIKESGVKGRQRCVPMA